MCYSVTPIGPKELEGEKEYVAQDITIKQDRLLNLDVINSTMSRKLTLM